MPNTTPTTARSATRAWPNRNTVPPQGCRCCCCCENNDDDNYDEDIWKPFPWARVDPPSVAPTMTTKAVVRLSLEEVIGTAAMIKMMIVAAAVLPPVSDASITNQKRFEWAVHSGRLSGDVVGVFGSESY